ncbi:DNA-binding protein [Bartonella henselae]|uniref:heme biosynthesis protein HemY n=2 Tax=Bartonella TaxID=773 RepID=UPI0009661735|nr:heme biosynthesis HemY N-terminal domain-containing protein [Bartonella henselae]OLL53187.1 DNA-binding protein [Bartonella henselae]OLL55881.1 DNA-binding protein [Bartonella henselae]UJM32383.1 DNA-binding protein [Bartonella henselae]
MIRILIYTFVVCLFGLAFEWVANYNDVLVITFSHFRFSVSLLTALSLLILFLGILALLWWLFSILFSVPHILSNYFYKRRQKHGYEALSQGFLAVFAGDAIVAQKMQTRVEKYLAGNRESLAKLLQAQTLSLQNNSARAIGLYEQMRKEKQTKLAGLYGLFREAMKTNAYEAAQQYAQEAQALSPALLWAHQAVLDRLSAEGSWDKALDVFEQAQKALPRSVRLAPERQHLQALLLSGQALHLLRMHPVDACKAILKAHKLVPDFIPITVIAADILYKLNETRKADKMVVAAWQKEPHPDLGALYLEREEGAVGRLKKAKTLASYNKDTFESTFLIAKAALDAGERVLAREQAQKALQYHKRESVYLLLADIEEAQGNNQAAVRQWLSLALRAERDPVWMCDGTIFSSWAVVSPISGRLGCFEWKAPPRMPPLTLEADTLVLTKKDQEDKEDRVDKNAVVEGEMLEKSPSVKVDLLHHAQIDKQDTNKQDTEESSQIRLNVDDPGVKIEEDAFLSKKKFRLF